MNMFSPQIDPSVRSDAEPRRPSMAEAEAAARTLLRWAGDDPGPAAPIDLTALVGRTAGGGLSGAQPQPIPTASRPTPAISRRCPTCRTAPRA